MNTYTPTLKNGQLVQFDVNGIPREEFALADADTLFDHDGQLATIVSFDTATAGEDDEPMTEFEYYTIRFAGGQEFEAISGFHLTPVAR